MQLLAELNLKRTTGNALIQLLIGDLSSIPPEHAIDILVVSAFPNDYTPLKGSLFLALQEKGLSMKELAAEKQTDLVPQLGCWISQTLTPEQQRVLNFKRVLCFEPRRQADEPQSVVGNIFRCINTFAFDEENDEVAMPILATGYQRAALEKMLPALLDSATFWLENGLPLKCIKFVLYRQEQVAIALPTFEQYINPVWSKRLFVPVSDAPAINAVPETSASNPRKAFTGEYTDTPKAVSVQNTPFIPQTPVQPSATNQTYDYFISYSHKQQSEVGAFVNAFLEKNKGLNIFYDRSSIPAGGLWLKKISEAIQYAKAVVCILTPDYITSDVCWDEFQCAKVMELRTKKSIIKTINFIQDDNLPPVMAIYSYIDCTEANLEKLKKSIDQLL